jgi:exosortase A
MSEWVNDNATAPGRTGQEGDKAIAGATVNTLVTLLVVYSLSVMLVFHETLISMVSIWQRSETFTHGFLILPISLWLTWRMRDRFNSLTVRPESGALIVILGAGLAWLLANLVDVLVVQQLAFVAMLVSGVWAITGTQVTRHYAFPLGFLFFAVPMGAGLIPPLMAFTADNLEFLLQASGVPVLREDMFLHLPTGSWSVVEACSGLNYLVASVVLGLCYAHLTYTSLSRKAAFLAAAIVVPILANSARAYIVVMVGHLSEMRYGRDHILFGWLFFGVIMLLVFWIGSFWQQHDEPRSTTGSKDAALPRRAPALRLTVIAGVAVLCAGLWSAIAFTMNRNSAPIELVALAIPQSQNTWQAVDSQGWNWYPAQPGADRELDQVYVTSTGSEPATVGLYLRQYLTQRQGVELVNNTNLWSPGSSTWQVMGVQSTRAEIDQSVQVTEARISSGSQSLLIWSWYYIDNRNTANPYLVKLLEAKQQIFEGYRRGTRVFIATPLREDRNQARQVLQDFVTANRTAIETALDIGIAEQRDSINETSSTGTVE